MIETRSERIINARGGVPIASDYMAKNVSQYRRATLEEEVAQGRFREKANTGFASPHDFDGSSRTQVGNVLGSMRKVASVYSTNGSGAGSWTGTGGSARQIPEIYSPLWLNSNLNLPRDRATINAWARAFFALNPIVQNAITLHSTYPISKLNITCKDEKIQQFFEDMIEEIGLMNICSQIAQEFWVLGEAFPYAELDEGSGRWSRIILQNPDYVVVKHSVIAGEPILSLRSDENLKRIVTSNRPSDMQQRQRLDRSIIEHVQRGENIPLSNFYASHIARKLNPYEVRGTSLIVSCFRNLMLYDKLRECHDEETEVLTNKGFKQISDLLETTDNLLVNPNYIAGTSMQEDLKILALKPDIEIACFNKNTEELEYHKPNEIHMSYYEGEMLHFTGNKVDACVTRNHKMWAQKKTGGTYSPFEKIKAGNFNNKSLYKFRSTAKWTGKNISHIDVLGCKIPVKLYLKFLGYVLSEGCIDSSFNKKTGQFRNRISLSQLTSSECFNDIKHTLECMGDFLNKKVSSEITLRGSGFSKHAPKETWIGTISSKRLVEHLISEVSINNKWDSGHKRFPRWALDLNSNYLENLLSALVAGDGSITKISAGNGYRYFTSCKELADDVQEAAFKCGYPVFISKEIRDSKPQYIVRWSDAKIGEAPIIYNSPDQKLGKIEPKQYKGIVWCFDVPTGLFVTRRNNRISIHGNSKFAQADNMINPLTLVKIGGAGENFKPSQADLEEYRRVFEEAQYDKDFKVFTHDAVTVERIGYNSGIIDISPDIDKLTKEIYMGLMTPQVLMDGGGDVTYANGGITLDVLKQRYLQFRNMLSAWLRTKIFAPISKINEFYEYRDNKKMLVVPDVEWNHMSLFDAGDYISSLMQLRAANQESPEISKQSLYRSFGLDFEDESRKLRVEAIQDAILAKEKEALKGYSLNELRTLNPDDAIEYKDEEPVPGEQHSDKSGESEGGEMDFLPGTEPPGLGGEGEVGGDEMAPPAELTEAPPA